MDRHKDPEMSKMEKVSTPRRAYMLGGNVGGNHSQ